MCVCVCEGERERERAYTCATVCVHVCVYLCLTFHPVFNSYHFLIISYLLFLQRAIDQRGRLLRRLVTLL